MQVSIWRKAEPLQVNPGRPVPACVFLHIENKCLSTLVGMRIYTNFAASLFTIDGQPPTINYNTLLQGFSKVKGLPEKLTRQIFTAVTFFDVTSLSELFDPSKKNFQIGQKKRFWKVPTKQRVIKCCEKSLDKINFDQNNRFLEAFQSTAGKIEPIEWSVRGCQIAPILFPTITNIQYAHVQKLTHWLKQGWSTL